MKNKLRIVAVFISLAVGLTGGAALALPRVGYVCLKHRMYEVLNEGYGYKFVAVDASC